MWVFLMLIYANLNYPRINRFIYEHIFKIELLGVIYFKFNQDDWPVLTFRIIPSSHKATPSEVTLNYQAFLKQRKVMAVDGFYLLGFIHLHPPGCGSLSTKDIEVGKGIAAALGQSLYVWAFDGHLFSELFFPPYTPDRTTAVYAAFEQFINEYEYSTPWFKERIDRFLLVLFFRELWNGRLI